jgi:hypothetical protein
MKSLLALGFSIGLITAISTFASIIEINPWQNQQTLIELDHSAPGAELATFIETNPGYSIVDWDLYHHFPHRIIGGGITLGSGEIIDSTDLEERCRNFIRQNHNVFGFRDYPLEAVHLEKHGKIWYASFAMTNDGHRVLFADTEFRLGATGELLLFGSDVNAINQKPQINLDRQRALSRLSELAADLPGEHQLEIDADWILIPVPGEKEITYEAVWACRANLADPEADFRLFISAESGQPLLAWNMVRHLLVEGQLNCMVEPTQPDEIELSEPFAWGRVELEGIEGFCDAEGNFAIEVPGVGPWQLSGDFSGAFADVNRMDSGDSQFSRMLYFSHESHTFDVNDALIEERDAYIHTNLIHDFIKSLDESFTGLDQPLPVNINIDQTCNAFWNGSSINFFREGGGCPNTAQVAGVLYHEYGHGINDRQYMQAGSPFGMANGALHEGLADVNAVFLQDVDFVSPGWVLRQLDNNNYYPFDISGEVHHDGKIIGGAMWDLRQSLGLEYAQHLYHFARWGKPDNMDTGRAFFDYYLEVLLVDDDNADLSDLTPNFEQIDEAFNLHGIGSELSWIGIDFRFVNRPLLTTPDETLDLQIFLTTPPFIENMGVYLIYSIDGADDVTQAAIAEGDGYFSAQVPAQQDGARVEYHAWMDNGLDDEGFFTPPGAPDYRHYTYFLAPPSILLDFENNDGAATASGSWQHGEPVSGPVEAASGVELWATNLYGSYGDFVVDVMSFPARQISSEQSFIRFNHWMSIEQGWDAANVRISINGDNYQTLFPVDGYDFVTPSNNAYPDQSAWTGYRLEWETAQFDLEGIAGPGDTVALMFSLMSDGSVTDTGWYIDDLEYLGFAGATEIVHSPLPDTEDISNENFDVIATLETEITLNSFDLFWRLSDGTETIVAMEPTGVEYEYSGQIQGPFENQQIEYWLVASGDGYSARHPGNENEVHTFYVGQDQIPPTVEFTFAPLPVIGQSATTMISAVADDFNGITGVFVNWREPGESWQATPLVLQQNSLWSAEVYFHVDSEYVEFQLEATDGSTQANIGFSELIAVEVGEYQRVDYFESSELNGWQIDGQWASQNQIVYEGDWAMGAGGGAGLPVSVDWTSTWENSIDLEFADNASLVFHDLYFLEGDDLVQIELSRDGQIWENLLVRTGSTADWNSVEIDLSEFLGEAALRLRFRLLTDAQGGNSMGYGVDQIELIDDGTGVEAALNPQSTRLAANYPNPFNPHTRIDFHLEKRSAVKLAIYNLSGQLVSQLTNGIMAGGSHSVMFDGSDLASGLYYYRLQTADFSQTKKMLLLK